MRSINARRLARETDAWVRLVRESNLPVWLKSLTLNSAATAFSNTLLTREGEFAVQENPGGGEGALGALEKRWGSGVFWRTFFPDLDRRELELFRACQQPSGEMPRLYGNAYRGIGNPNVWQGITGTPEPACIYVTEVLAHYRATGDRKFLDAAWPGVKQAMAWLRQAKTSSSFGATAIRAAMAMARIEGEPELVRDCENALANQHPPESMGVSPDHGSGKAAGAETIADQMQPRVSENAQRTYEAVYRYSKSPWGLPTRVDMTFANPPTSCESDMGALAAWMLLPAVTGAAIDVPGQRLMLSPRLPVGMKKLHAPVFCARFWAWLDYSAEEFRLKIVQHFGEPLELRELASDASAAAIKLPEPFAARADASLDLSPLARTVVQTESRISNDRPESPALGARGSGHIIVECDSKQRRTVSAG